MKIQNLLISLFVVLGLLFGCSSTQKEKNKAKEQASQYWLDKAYPGKAYDVQVIDAEPAEDGLWRVKGIVDGETRVGVFNPETESFTEGFYSLTKERNKRIAELEQEVKYWKEKAEGYEKEIFKYKVLMDKDKKSEKKE